MKALCNEQMKDLVLRLATDGRLRQQAKTLIDIVDGAIARIEGECQSAVMLVEAIAGDAFDLSAVRTAMEQGREMISGLKQESRAAGGMLELLLDIAMKQTPAHVQERELLDEAPVRARTVN